MTENARDVAGKATKSSKELLYSEYMETSSAEHVVNILEKQKKAKPNMCFKRSGVMDRVNKLLPLLEQSQKELNEKSSEEKDIEVISGTEFVEMNVGLIRSPNSDSDCNDNGLEFHSSDDDNTDQEHEHLDTSESSDEEDDDDESVENLNDVSQLVKEHSNSQSGNHSKLVTVIDDSSSSIPGNESSREA